MAKKIEYIFYRILGNDIPLRHRKGQTISNLEVILDREIVFSGVEKRWIVNRIVEPTEEKRIIALLKWYGQQYQVIPFDRKKFKALPKECYKERLDELIGLNRARNMALREGRQCGRWVFVFDGNCFFTAQSWRAVTRACAGSNFKYVIVPMKRMIEGSRGVLSEPQIIFRRDAKDEFDEDFGYGQCSKIDLLRRLGVPGVWDEWDDPYKELSMKRRSKEFGRFEIAGHVWRLPSGNEAAEKDIQKRKEYRDRGIMMLMNRIDRE